MTISPAPPPYPQPPKGVRSGALSDLHAYARLYAEMGWAVFPCRERGKEPLTQRGFQDASTERAQIDAWWKQWPQANIGLATGQRSGIVIVDVDPKNGGSLEQLAALFPDEQLPPTKIVETGGGGWHLYFRQNDGDEDPELDPSAHVLIPSSVGKLRESDGSVQGIAPGIDTRGEGGYVIAAPSIHPDGPCYLWQRGSTANTILGFPSNLTDLLLAHQSVGTGRLGSVVGSGPTDDKKVTAGRNNFLTSYGGKLRKDGVTGEALFGALWAMNIQFCEPPLGEREVETIARSVNRYLPSDNNLLTRHEQQEQRAAKSMAESAQPPQAQNFARAREGRPPRASRQTGSAQGMIDLAHDDAPLVPAEPLPDTLRLQDQEREIVAAIIADAELAGDQPATLLGDVATVLRPKHLYDPQARAVYQAIFALDLLGKPISLSLIDAQAKAVSGETYADYPGVEAIRAWMGQVSRLDFDPYLLALCRTIEESARRRALVILSKQLHADALGVGSQVTGAAPTSALDLAANASRTLAALTEQGLTGERDLAEFVAEYDAQLDFWRQHAGEITGASSGLHVIDQHTNGIQPGDLWVVAGRASMGKTAWALTCAAHNASYMCEPGERVGIVTLEMSGRALIHRMVGMASGYAPYNIMTGRGVDDTHVRATLRSIAQMPLHIMDATTSVIQTNGVRGTVTPEVVRARVKAWQRQGTLKLLILDYLQLLRTPPGLAHSTREQQVAEMCAAMKRLAQECNIPVVLLAQLSRATEQRGDRLPQMSDIRESGGVEQDADVIVMLFRQSYYADRGISVTQESESVGGLQPASLYTPGKAQIKIEKNRNGPVGVYDAYFDKPGMRYYDWDAQLGAPVDYTGQPAPVQPPPAPGGNSFAIGSAMPTSEPPRPPRSSGATRLNYNGESGEWSYRAASLPYPDDTDDTDDTDDLDDTDAPDAPEKEATP